MTKKKLELLAIDFAEGNVNCCDYACKYSKLSDCYKSYSEEKSRAYWCDVEEFNQEVLLMCHYGDVNFKLCIPSYNSMMFTLFQVAFLKKGETIYIAYRYDSRSKTIEGYLTVNVRYGTMVRFPNLDNFKNMCLANIK